MIDPASSQLNLLDSIGQGECKQTQGNNWQREQTEKQTSICCSFHMVSRGGPSAVSNQPESAL
jgi:hypothetical protein